MDQTALSILVARDGNQGSSTLEVMTLTGQVQSAFRTGYAANMELSRDGRRLAAGSPDSLSVYDLASDTLKITLVINTAGREILRLQTMVLFSKPVFKMSRTMLAQL